MPYGFVYLAYNASMPGLYKIGSTNAAPMERVRQLSNTSTPTKFWLLAYAQVEDARSLEMQIHAEFNHLRVRSNREFFLMNSDELRAVCDLFEEEGATSWHSHVDLLYLGTLDPPKKEVRFEENSHG